MAREPLRRRVHSGCKRFTRMKVAARIVSTMSTNVGVKRHSCGGGADRRSSIAEFTYRMSEPGDMAVTWTVSSISWGNGSPNRRRTSMRPCTACSPTCAFDERGGWHVQGAMSCAHWLAWRVGWDLVTARDRVRVARKLAEFPAFDDALRRGEVRGSGGWQHRRPHPPCPHAPRGRRWRQPRPRPPRTRRFPRAP